MTLSCLLHSNYYIFISCPNSISSWTLGNHNFDCIMVQNEHTELLDTTPSSSPTSQSKSPSDVNMLPTTAITSPVATSMDARQSGSDVERIQAGNPAPYEDDDDVQIVFCAPRRKKKRRRRQECPLPLFFQLELMSIGWNLHIRCHHSVKFPDL